MCKKLHQDGIIVLLTIPLALFDADLLGAGHVGLQKKPEESLS